MDFLPGGRNEERSRVSFSDNRIGNNMLARILTRKRQDDNQKLDEIIDIDKDIQIFQQNQLRLLNPKILYNTGYFSNNSQLYRHYREEQLSAIGSKVATLNLVNPDSVRQIKNYKRNLMINSNRIKRIN